MVKRSKGALSKNTKKLARKKRTTVTDIIRKLSIGQKVILTPTAYRGGLPHPRYANRHGIVIEERGKSYVVRIRDGNMMKNIIAHPIHLKLSK